MEVDYNNYFTELREQRTNQPIRPKLDNLLPIGNFNTVYVGRALTQVMTEGYTYTGIIRTQEILYPIGHIGQTDKFNDDNLINDFFMADSCEYDECRVMNLRGLYYEFVNHKPINRSTLKDWSYLYIPVLKSGSYVLKDKLPNVYSWNTNQPSPSFEKPLRANLLRKSESNWKEELDINNEGLTHPFLPNMYFTGKITRFSDSTIAYEYYDNRGYYGPLYETYFTYLAPLDLDYPVGIPTDNYLYTDECWQGKIDQYPTYGYFIQGLPKFGSFLGYITNDSYDSNVTYYLYQAEDSSLFLSQAPPHPQARAFAESLQLNLDITNLVTNIQTDISNTQRVLIVQKSLCNPTKINDETKDVAYINIIGDCTFFNNEYLINPCTYELPIDKTITGNFGNCVMIDDLWNYHGIPPSGIHILNSIIIFGDEYTVGN